MKPFLSPWVLIFGAFVLVALHLFFNEVHLYFLFWWLDVPMHVLSGLFVSLTTLFVVFHEKFLNTKDSSTVFVVSVSLASVLTVGLFWEIYGYFFHHVAPAIGGAQFDTLKDLFNDLFGGLLGAFIFLGKGYNRKI